MEVNFEAGDVNSKLERYSFFFFCIPSSNDMVVKIKGENVTFYHQAPRAGKGHSLYSRYSLYSQ